MAYPDDGPVTLDDVKTWSSVTGDTFDVPMTAVVDAVNDLVRALPIVVNVDPEPDVFAPRVIQGGVMLAARIWRRRNSIDGVQALTDEGASYVSRSDPDVAQLLGIGSYSKPGVG